MLSYAETLDFLFDREVERMQLGLERVERALALCGSPHTRFPSLHIAGTNGKGSTAALLHAVLRAAGYRVGLYTSPHLLDFCERIRLGDGWIRQQDVVDGVAWIRSRLGPAQLELTPFELMRLLAFVAFARAEVDIAVVEVGLGGRLDATNVLSPLVTTITQIGLDHQAYLGSDLARIAAEKGGIIKPGVPVVVGRMEADSQAVLIDIARRRGSPSLVYGRDFWADAGSGHFGYRGRARQYENLPLGLAGAFQVDNAAAALASLECLSADFPVSGAQLCHGLRQVVWPGRFQIVSDQSNQALVILDGAHNPHAVAALVSALPEVLGERRVRLLFGVMDDKDWPSMVPPLARIAHQAVVTRVRNPRAADPQAVATAFAEACPTRVCSDARAACQQLLDGADADTAVVVCGSLFLVGEVLPLFPSALREQSR